ncbi:hypothetical protein N9K06_01130, partial [Omnitrophica bacterium]|nr:hypothetical protein [Candidatus Omnitrophota bacterium]
MKLVASLVVFTFIFSSLTAPSRALAALGFPSPEGSALAASTLEIPSRLGRVTETLIGDPEAPVFIHIQSAHGNYQAEKNIEELLQYIETNSPLRLMLLEGAAQRLQPELFRVFPNRPDFNRKVTDKLMQEGFLTGPEAFLVGSAQKIEG